MRQSAHSDSSESSELRWAARYTFCDAQWRGRARVVADADLEALLRDDVASRLGGSSLELLDALLPRERGVPVWMIVGNDETARALAPSRPGVRFVPASAGVDVLARERWEVVLLGLRTNADDMGTDATGLATTIDEGPARAFGRHASVWMDAIADAVARGRSAVLAVDADEGAYESLVEVTTTLFGDARMYAVYRPSIVAFVELDGGEQGGGNGFDDAAAGELGDALDDEGIDEPNADDDEDELSAIPTHNRYDRWDVDDDAGEEESDEDEAVPLSFDNTLGIAEPRFVAYVALVGPGETPEGLTLVEVPPAAAARPAEVIEPADPALRHQLAQARRQADLVAIERQRLVEHIDAIEADNAALREAVAQLRDQLAGALEPAAAGERLDAALAREQSLRWRVAALERELAELRVRPVDELEAELASARARLSAVSEPAAPRVVAADRTEDADDHAHAQRGGDRGPAPPPHETDDDVDGGPNGAPPSNGHLGRRVGTDDARRLPAVRAAASGRTAALRAVEGLVRRIDRGAIGTIDLRRELTALRRRLRG